MFLSHTRFQNDPFDIVGPRRSPGGRTLEESAVQKPNNSSLLSTPRRARATAASRVRSRLVDMSRNNGSAASGPEKRKDLAAGAHKTKSREFYDIIRQIGTRPARFTTLVRFRVGGDRGARSP